MRVLLLQGDARGAVQAEIVLRHLDYAVDKVATVEEADDALAVNAYDLLVADLDTVDASITPFLRAARAATPHLRLLVMVVRERMDIVAEALEHGAGDFLVKPMDPAELRLRLHNLSARRSDDRAILECGPLKLHLNSGEVLLDGRAVVVTPRERAVLQILLRESGNVVGKDYIASRIFSMDNEATPAAIETYVSRLRRKLTHPRVQIRTVHGLGYLLAPAPAETVG